MAIEKSIESNFGIEFNYWKLSSVQIMHSKKECLIEVKGYINKDKFEADPNKFIARQFRCTNSKKEERSSVDGEVVINIIEINKYDENFAPEVLEAAGVTPQKQAYLFLKSLPEFQGAVDLDL